jgi:hypothetical protein
MRRKEQTNNGVSYCCYYLYRLRDRTDAKHFEAIQMKELIVE